MSVSRLIRKQSLNGVMFLPRLLRGICKKGRTKAAITAFFILLTLITSLNRQKRNTIKSDLVQDSIKNSEKVLSPVRNIQEYIVLHDVKKEVAVKNLTPCKRFPPQLVGNMSVNQNITPSFEEVEHVSSPQLLNGGCFTPVTCTPRQKVAVIIPFKDREAHLKTLLFYLHPMLAKQQLQYCIYVAEQFDNGTFNKAMVMNSAFEEVMKLDNYDCIVFHDVDMIPEHDHNLYTCAKHPRHLSPAIDKFKYKPHYGTDFGGVTAITPQQYRKANGHSNQFWGWGGEDNDMEFRIRHNKMKILAVPMEHGRYKMIFHKHPWKFMSSDARFNLNKTRIERAETDGLSDLAYRVMGIDRRSTYTKLIIDIRKIDVKAISLFIDGKPVMSIDVEPGECRWQEYPGKYLDFNIELSQYPEAAHLKALRMNQQASDQKLPNIPSHVKEQLAAIPSQPVRFSLVDGKAEAMELCDKLAPLCLGIQREGTGNRYSLRRTNTPRNIVITGPAEPKIKRRADEPVKKKYYFPDKTVFLKYCPGGAGGFIQGYMNPLDVDLNINQSKVQHTYSFEIYFSVLLQPTKNLFYSDTKQFESQMSKVEKFYPFLWPNLTTPDFSLADTPQHYKFKTEEFVVPNTPGCYTVRSKILDQRQHPYYMWNWWVEVKSDDRSRDAALREVFWKKQLQSSVLSSHTAVEQKEIEERRKRQEKREYQFKKEMAELRGEKFKENKALDENSKDDSKKESTLKSHARNIEVFDPIKGYPKIKFVQLPPKIPPSVQQEEVRHKAFHAGLPGRLQKEHPAAR